MTRNLRRQAMAGHHVRISLQMDGNSYDVNATPRCASTDFSINFCQLFYHMRMPENTATQDDGRNQPPSPAKTTEFPAGQLRSFPGCNQAKHIGTIWHTNRISGQAHGGAVLIPTFSAHAVFRKWLVHAKSERQESMKTPLALSFKWA